MNWMSVVLYSVAMVVVGGLVYMGKLPTEVLAGLVGVLVPSPLSKLPVAP